MSGIVETSFKRFLHSLRSVEMTVSLDLYAVSFKNYRRVFKIFKYFGFISLSLLKNLLFLWVRNYIY